jgi:hypothetical protein
VGECNWILIQKPHRHIESIKGNRHSIHGVDYEMALPFSLFAKMECMYDNTVSSATKGKWVSVVGY